MSYEFELCFKQVKNEVEAYRFARGVMSVAFDNAQKIIKQNLWKRPSVNYQNGTEVADYYWLHSLLNFRFVYWHEHKILGLFDTGYPDEIKNCFDTNQFFQNATDQNYPLSEWNDKINLFEQIKTECQSLSKENLKKEWNTYGFEIDEDNPLPDNYELCHIVYHKIYQALHLDEWEGDCESDSFTKFAMSPFTSGQKASHMRVLYRIAMKEYLEEGIDP